LAKHIIDAQMSVKRLSPRRVMHRASHCA
jgi:hypothetical protein